MKVVLRHQTTGRYYAASGEWVRRADNALSFDDTISAQAFLRMHQLGMTQAVFRLAPYVTSLLQQTSAQSTTLHVPFEMMTNRCVTRSPQFGRN